MKTFTRVLIMWATSVVALIILTYLLKGIHVTSLGTAVATAAVIGLLNALLWPTLSYIFLPFAVLTLGFGALIMNGLVILLAGTIVPGFQVDTLWWAVLLSVGLTAINAMFASLLTIDDDSAYYRNVLRKRMRRKAEAEQTDEPGFIFIEIDGLSKPVLERALREGYLPTLARWLEAGSHRLVGWETDLSAQTSASQAGILHGNNHNIAAFRWYDRSRKEIVTSSDPRFVARLEKSLSDGDGLLSDNGASRGNMFSGDAPHVMNTASAILDKSRFHASNFYGFMIYPYNFARMWVLIISDVILEMRQFRKAQRERVEPILDRAHRGGVYPLLRAFMTVMMHELNVYVLIGDMYAGVPSAYGTFAGYDEVAHHSGVESEDALDILRKLDRHIARLEAAASEAPRPYHLVVLSDHGQTGGTPFKQRYQMSLEDLIQKLLRDKFRIQGDVDVHEDWKHVNVFLTETVQDDRGVVGTGLGRALKNRTEEGQVTLGPESAGPEPESNVPAEPGGSVDDDPGENVIVLVSGNLALLYGTRTPERATLEQIEQYYPGLLDGLARHEGIGFAMVRSEERGSVVIGAHGRYYLNDDQVEGENPLADFGPNAARHLRRSDSFPDVPDIYVNSFYNPETNEGTAFEAQVGFHGGLGGYQTQPFLLFPAEFELGEAELVGAASVYRVLKEWQTGIREP